MLLRSTAVALGLCLLATNALAAPPAKPKPPQPKLISGQAPELPEEARAIGAQGIVTLKGTVRADGTLTDVVVVEGTGSDLVDRTALEAFSAAKFAPAVDAEGKPVDASVTMKVDLLKDSVLDKRRDVTKKTCADFVIDFDWFRSTHPNDENIQMPLYSLMLGTYVVMRGMEAESMLTSARQIKIAWPATYEECRKHPDKLFFEQLNKRMR